MIGAVMLDIAGTTLSIEDQEILRHPQTGGVILFGRNIESPQQVRTLTDAMRAIRPELLIAVDQEGGRVQRLRAQHGFSALPPMGRLGQLYREQPQVALTLAQQCGKLMASEVLAVGIDFSFAPVLDIDDISDVIGDRGFADNPQDIIALAAAFMQGMRQAGMATTGKHFPGHGSIKADSHVATAIDLRSFAEIEAKDMQPFMTLLPMLDALMPAHVVYPQVDIQPAGFSSVWLQQIIRNGLNFDGVLFSDDLSMQAAHVVGGADARLQAAIQAGCDMGLVCNNRDAAMDALRAAEHLPLPHQARLEKMRGQLPTVDFDTQGQFSTATTSLWQHEKNVVAQWLDSYA